MFLLVFFFVKILCLLIICCTFAPAKQNTVAVVQLVRASDCGPEGRGFKPHQPPDFL